MRCKCIDTAEYLCEKGTLTGWRKSKEWRKALKGLMRIVGKTSSGGGMNKAERLQDTAKAYLAKSRALEKKVTGLLENYQPSTNVELIALLMLEYYHEMLTKHIDLLERRLVRGEVIPHEEKVFSIFQPYAEMIKKGKLHPNVEIGKKLALTSDQYHLIVDWQIAENQTDSQLTLPIANRLAQKYSIQSLSVDRGFSDKEDKALLESFIPEVIMQKKGKPNKEEKTLESAPVFKRLKDKHSAIESNINELEHRGLNRVPNRTRWTFGNYIGLAITAYNLHKIGRKLQAIYLKEEEKAKKKAKLLQAA
ncbi:MAG: transposase [Bacteroidetes bacterium]|nr:transposase [Bacteroidota bacterium]